MIPFVKQQVEGSRPDGYWIEAFPFRVGDKTTPDLVAYGLGTAKQDSKIQLYSNPYNKANGITDFSWPVNVIAELKFPVAFSYADITGNGFNDMIISDNYGPSMSDIWPEGGTVFWYQNDGTSGYQKWTRRYIGKSPGMHRLKAGHFSNKDKVQIVAVPIVIKSNDLESPAPVIIYTAPDRPTITEDPWDSVVAFNMFRLVHEVVVLPGLNNGLDEILLAGREGITIIWYDTANKRWQSKNVGTGLPRSTGNPYWGSGSVAVARVGDDSCGYIASTEAFHGNHISVYIKPANGVKNSIRSNSWTRYELDNLGPLNDQHTGSIHHVICADVDGDGIDEFLVACMGSSPPAWSKTGVWCYKPVDLTKGTFTKFKLSDDSAGRIAVADFRASGRIDFATISYSVPGYFESPNPSVNAYFGTPISVERLNEEVLFRLPKPSDTFLVDEVEFLDVAGRKLSIVLLPKGKRFAINEGDGVKVIAGKLFWKDKNGEAEQRTMATRPFHVVSTAVFSDDGFVVSDFEGAAFMLMKHSTTSGKPPFSDMKQLVAHNIFPPTTSESVRHMTLPWVKVENRPWANGGFKGLEFYNLIGFHVRLADDSDSQVCHIQLWTAGVNVSAGFHNHSDKSFAEIHACLVNGTGKGGMYWATVPDQNFDPGKPDPTKYKGVVVPAMAEHGPLWRTGPDGLPLIRKNDTVDYPWHAWIAGPGSPSRQAFDVWVAFEFPSFLADIEVEASYEKLSPGTYHIVNVTTSRPIAVSNGNPADGSAVIFNKKDDYTNATWVVSRVPGTSFFTFKNTTSNSFATVFWPPVNLQRIIGSRSPAAMLLTSAWGVQEYKSGTFKIRLISTSLSLTAVSKGNEVDLVLREVEPQEWKFVPIAK